MNPKTRKAIDELRHDVKPSVDPQTFEMVKESVERLYGWKWPEGVGYQDGCEQLFEYLISSPGGLCRGRKWTPPGQSYSGWTRADGQSGRLPNP